MASITKIREELQEDLQDQLDGLRQEITQLRKDIAKRSSRAYRQGRHYGDDAMDMFRDYLESAIPALRRNARSFERTARDHPMTTAATAVVGLAVIGLAVALFSRR
ncbi:MAG TPA: hypothetical protein VFT89_09985 [Rhizobiaceae bacterium]|nr:hypothetical protein [Rhizobiaceae bacterium]